MSFGLWTAGDFLAASCYLNIVLQVVGAVLGAGMVHLIASGQPGGAGSVPSAQPTMVAATRPR